jgi:hypothetical protein
LAPRASVAVSTIRWPSTCGMAALFAFLCRRLLTPLVSGNQRRKRAAVPFRELGQRCVSANANLEHAQTIADQRHTVNILLGLFTQLYT